jgi:Flp pilus assembly pilin Flp
MNLLMRFFIKAQMARKGQTMTEYALILAAVAIIVFAVYQVMGQNITTLVAKINTALSSS